MEIKAWTDTGGVADRTARGTTECMRGADTAKAIHPARPRRDGHEIIRGGYGFVQPIRRHRKKD